MYNEYIDKMEVTRRELFSISWIITENSLYLFSWITAGWLLTPLRLHGWPVATIIWAVIVIAVQIVLKKHNCSGCYYYGKNCHLGWGRISACIFRQDSGSMKTGMRLSMFYPVSPPVILLASVAIGIFCSVTVLHWVLAGLYIVLNLISFPVRKIGCRLCAMRNVCFGSAVK